MKLEKQIQREVIDYLQWLENMGIVYFMRTQSGMIPITGKTGKVNRMFKTGKVGAPDITCCWKGKFVGIEIKAEKGKQTDAQIEAQTRIEEAGGLYFLVRDVGELRWFKEEV